MIQGLLPLSLLCTPPLLWQAPLGTAAPDHGLRVPAGFEVTQFADDKLANDIYTLTIDPQGRIVVAGRGYIRILVDDDGDGRADRALDFADAPKDGAMGLLWEGDTLYATGDGGLRRFRDQDGDGKADRPSELIRALKTGGEHSAHALRRGPDGWLYVLCGNNTGIDKSYATLPTSPIQEPIAGCVLRFSPDLKQSEIVAHGFRNPYGMDFNLDGELFTYDSDNERCVSLPWYEPTRFYHVIERGHYGWLSPQRATFWRLPPYYLDVVAPVAYLGRGSPTGVVCYRHLQFPEEYRGGFFLADWTFGRIHFVKTQRRGSSYIGTPKVFAEAVGDNGFAPTGLAVHPATGDLYVSIGGRGTRGGVYRIRYPKGLRPGIEEHARKLAPAQRTLAWTPAAAAELARGVHGPSGLDRLNALAALRRHHERVKAAFLQEAFLANWEHPDRYIRRAAAELFPHLPGPVKKSLARDAKFPWPFVTLMQGALHQDRPLFAKYCFTRPLSKDDPEVALAMLRLWQLYAGDIGAKQTRGLVFEGYTLRQPADASFPWLDRVFPSGHSDLDREITRSWALIHEPDPDSAAEMVKRLTAGSNPVEDLHYLIVLAKLGVQPRQPTAEIADALVSLDRKIARRGLNRDTHWPLRVAELYAELARRDAALNAAVLSHPDFGRPDHALFTRAPGFDVKQAAKVFLQRSKTDPDFAWNADLIDVLGALPDADVRPVLRQLWGQAGLDAAILPLLARNPRPEDRDKFVSGLTSTNPATVYKCLAVLAQLPPGDESGRSAEVPALIRGLGQHDDKQVTLRTALAQRLHALTGQQLGSDARAWTNWFAKNYPQAAARLLNRDGVDVGAWDKRLARIVWDDGEAARGKGVFVKASCATCHSGNLALGPDLAGVAGRFSRQDLFTAILQPSRDVPARYQTTLVETKNGNVYQGLVIYDAVDSLILHTGAGQTVRLGGAQVASRRSVPASLMPAGLLDKLGDDDIADLYAYLKSLGKTPK